MKRLFPTCLFLLSVGACALHAGPTEEAIVAIMRLSDQQNYSWVATVEDNARIYDIDAQTSKEGFTRVKMPVINSVRRRLGRSVTDTRIDMIFLGNVRCVLETERGWMRPEELPAPEGDDEGGRVIHASGALGIPGAGSLGGGLMKGVIIRQPPRPREPEDLRYSNLQLAISLPHEELGIIVTSHQEFTVEGDIVSGTLTNLGAQLLLVRDGQKQITPERANGTFKLWLREGVVTRYQLRLEGILTIDSSKGRRRVEVFQNTSTVVKNIGTTQFLVPEQALTKLLKGA